MTQPGFWLYIDLFGGGKTLELSDDEVLPGNNNVKYVMLITDNAIRMRWIFLMQTWNNPVYVIFGYINQLQNLGFTVAYIQSDNEFFQNPVEQ